MKGFKGLWVIDGVETKEPNFNPDDVTTMNVWKGDQAQVRYGDKGKNGVIEITTNKNQGKPTVRVVSLKRDSIKVRAVKLTTDTARTINKNYNYNYNNNNVKTTVTIRGLDSLKVQPLVLINGKVKTLAALNAIAKNQITTVNVLKSDAAVAVYGKGAANGVIIVQTKDTVTIK
jgi:TonB-dependent SusC/RagA subfamily outer membrane receptor